MHSVTSHNYFKRHSLYWLVLSVLIEPRIYRCLTEILLEMDHDFTSNIDLNIDSGSSSIFWIHIPGDWHPEWTHNHTLALLRTFQILLRKLFWVHCAHENFITVRIYRLIVLKFFFAIDQYFQISLSHLLDVCIIIIIPCLYCKVLYCIEGVVISAQCTATFSRSILFPRIYVLLRREYAD